MQEIATGKGRWAPMVYSSLHLHVDYAHVQRRKTRADAQTIVNSTHCKSAMACLNLCKHAGNVPFVPFDTIAHDVPDINIR